MGTLARDNLKILQQLRGRILEETSVIRSHWCQTWAQCKPRLSFGKNMLPFCYNIQHPLPDPLPRRGLSVLWEWEPSSSALSGGRCDPRRRTELASLFMEILFSFSVLSFFFFQFTVTFYLFVQKNKLVICTLHVALCHLLCLAPRRSCYVYSTVSTTNKLLRPREYKESKKGWDVSAIKTLKLDLKPLHIKKAPCKQKLKWDPNLWYYRL